MRALRDAEPDLSAPALLRIATAGGAEAIGVADRFGAIAPGMCADLAVFAVAETDDPTAALVAHGGRDTIEAVMSGGVWRVREGRMLERDQAAASRAADAARRAREFLAGR